MNRNGLTSMLLIMLIVSSIFIVTVQYVKATDVTITTVSPVDHFVVVGQTATVYGALNTTNGQYQVLFENQLVSEARVTGQIVNATFPVPHYPKGNHTITLRDVTANRTAASWLYINSQYKLTAVLPPEPRQLQQGDTVAVWVNVTGGNSTIEKRFLRANITVTLPSPLNSTFYAITTFNVTENGDGSNQTLIFPTDFQSTANTNYTGAYTLMLNKTLATSSFAVGMTNATSYHRLQMVNIKGLGYKFNEAAALRISTGTTVMLKQNLTANTGGQIEANWQVNSTAPISSAYVVNITSLAVNPTRKNPADIQTFQIPGYNVNITTINLAHQPVPNVTVKILEGNKSISIITNAQGLIQTKLETGSYPINGTYKTKKVAEQVLNVTGDISYNLTVRLTNLLIHVVTMTQTSVPDVSIFMRPDNVTLPTTNINGTATGVSLLPEVAKPYVLNFTRYGHSFNVTTLSSLSFNGTAPANYNLTVVIPTRTLRLNITKLNGEPLNNMQVKLRENSGGVLIETHTTPNGIAVVNLTFGSYHIEVYDTANSAVVLAETDVNVFQNQNTTITVSLLGLNFKIAVVDFFGQPISNANVIIEPQNQPEFTRITGSNGAVELTNTTGGAYQISVRLPGQAKSIVQGSYLVSNQTDTVTLRIDSYVTFVGMLVETGQLAIILVTIAVVITILAIEVYRRRHRKTETAKEDIESE